MKELLAEIVHDIRSPVASIKSGVYCVKEILPELIQTYREAQKYNLNIPISNEKILNSIEKIVNNIDNASTAVNDYLDELIKRSEKSE